MTSVTITPYQRRYRQDVRDLLFRAYRVHSHLDWNDTDSWLDHEQAPMRLAWAGNRLAGLIAVSAPLNATCWMRLAAVPDDLHPDAILPILWADLLGELRANGVKTVALLVLRDWIAHYVRDLGFHYVEDIVTLRRGSRALPEPFDYPVSIRLFGAGEINTITQVDQAAFEPPWQLTLNELRQAERVAAICTAAVLDDRVVGYQLSTMYFDGGHLARLAVLPEVQHHGVGRALLDDLLRRFARRGVNVVTVNTQATNVRSQHLYERFSFARNGYDLPVWMAEL